MVQLGASTALAQGGPPMITDDPDTPGPAHWEINLSTFFERHARSHAFELPRVDANYGVGRRIQLKLEMPWLRDNEDGSVRTGAGDMTAGVKYRFLGEEGKLIAWSVYPQLEFNTTHASVTKGLVEDGRQFFLPSELTVEKFHTEINVEIGRRFVQNAGDAWEYGLSTEGHVVPRVELLAELHGEGRSGTRDQLLLNVGARPKLTKQMILLLAAGRAIRGVEDERPRLLLYTGLQFNLPGQYSFKASRSSRVPGF
jgi:hypothetical protein